MGAPRFVMEDFWPSDLFLGGIPGAWYDPTDLSTMFQDSTGTTPVTAVEQPVGLILDKSQGVAVGATIVTNGDFSAGTTGWSAGNSATLTSPASDLRILGDGVTTYPSAYQSLTSIAGRWYRATVTLKAANVSALFILRNGPYGAPSGQALVNMGTTPGTYTVWLYATGALMSVGVEPASGAATFDATIDNVSVVPVAGNHASQSTAASRPTYRARYNLLTYSEQFDNAVWFRQALAGVTANAAVAPDGTTTADLVIADNTSTSTHRIASTPAVTTISGTSYTFSVYAKKSGAYEGLALTVDAPAVYVAFDLTNGVAGAGGTITNVGNGWFRCSVTFTAGASTLCRVWTFDTYANAAAQAAWTGNGTTGILLWGAQLLTAADVTATGNAYQRIAAATVYDTAPIFRPYLAFDGVDDSLSTAAINFTSTNKMTVYTGLSKLSDATLAIFAELSTVTGPNAGSWYIAAPITTGAGGNYSWRNAGTALSGSADSGTLLAPNTSVLTGTCDIGTLTQALRVNGALAASGIVAIGGGNYGNWPLFIGRRNNSTFPFNGRLFSLIVRGAASSVTEIADTELWVNARTGAY